ncbi:MAG: helix-turn-helix domain-containing protein [Firmicutes bacterium]|nr:helix-turn-helix domain-containing protein [Bacillota bacterium]
MLVGNQRGLSQAELARLLDVGQSTIAMYEKNRRSPDHQSLIRLADFFGVSTDYLLGSVDQPHANEREGAKGPPLDEKLLEEARAIINNGVKGDKLP